MRRPLIVAAIGLAIAGSAAAQSGDEKIAASFEALCKRTVDKNLNRPPTVVRENGVDFRHCKCITAPDYSFDVERTTSIVSPYLGTFTFDVVVMCGRLWDSREEAAIDSTLDDVPRLEKHVHRFAYQKRKWVLTSAEFKLPLNGISAPCPVDSSGHLLYCGE